MFEGFDTHNVTVAPGITVHARAGGAGPPLLMLHGYPQTHAMWHAVAPLLVDRYRCVAADLRGYGASSKPASAPDHAPYSKRAMAGDMVALMRALGHPRFAILAHDRGARVAHRLALDHPEAVTALVLLDIAPTREMYAHTTEGFARAYWHWFFLILPAPVPERMIGADPRAFWLAKCGSGAAGLAPFAEAPLAAYLAAFDDPATIHATCEDYRAAATIDIAHDNADGDRKLTQPLLALWGQEGAIAAHFDARALWQSRAERVSGGPVPGGHYLAEEHPQDIAARVAAFLAHAT